MKTYALIENGRVSSLFTTAGDMSEMFHHSMVWVDVTGVDSVSDGLVATEDDGVWTFAEYIPPPLTNAELKSMAMAQRGILLVTANEATAGMADAYIAGLMDADEEALFKTWAAYKLALNKIDKQPGYPNEIVWPVAPVAAAADGGANV